MLFLSYSLSKVTHNVLWLCAGCGNWNCVLSAGQNEVMKKARSCNNKNSNHAKPLLCDEADVIMFIQQKTDEV
ncbi:hypothetical protein ACI6PS_11610 [Flavobacterium sp. PLA-1-15]|uniref:hypothetical protein n=1 Tax=Flavobacterium sp. PLA-1-15 TaxID=3380533 RepID=UPI003B7BC9F6